MGLLNKSGTASEGRVKRSEIFPHPDRLSYLTRRSEHGH